jgi:hypothetical protein
MLVTKTRTELIREAADKLNIVGTGQVLEDEYAEKLDNAIDPMLAQLATDGICTVINDQQIPSEWFDALAGLLANVCAAVGGKGSDPRIKEYYEMQLRRLTSTGPSSARQEAEYF